jgi:outer membrane protein assembly factor BamD
MSDDQNLLSLALTLTDRGEHRYARATLQSIINSYPDSQFVPDAYWAIGLAFYKEGGTHNLGKAMDQFHSFLLFFPNGPSDLVQAAQLNIASIHLDLMHLGDSGPATIRHAQAAEKILTEFLVRWPQHPEAPAARHSLSETRRYISASIPFRTAG